MIKQIGFPVDYDKREKLAALTNNHPFCYGFLYRELINGVSSEQLIDDIIKSAALGEPISNAWKILFEKHAFPGLPNPIKPAGSPQPLTGPQPPSIKLPQPTNPGGAGVGMYRGYGRSGGPSYGVSSLPRRPSMPAYKSPVDNSPTVSALRKLPTDANGEDINTALRSGTRQSLRNLTLPTSMIPGPVGVATNLGRSVDSLSQGNYGQAGIDAAGAALTGAPKVLQLLRGAKAAPAAAGATPLAQAAKPANPLASELGLGLGLGGKAAPATAEAAAPLAQAAKPSLASKLLPETPVPGTDAGLLRRYLAPWTTEAWRNTDRMSSLNPLKHFTGSSQSNLAGAGRWAGTRAMQAGTGLAADRALDASGVYEHNGPAAVRGMAAKYGPLLSPALRWGLTPSYTQQQVNQGELARQAVKGDTTVNNLSPEQRNWASRLGVGVGAASTAPFAAPIAYGAGELFKNMSLQDIVSKTRQLPGKAWHSFNEPMTLDRLEKASPQQLMHSFGLQSPEELERARPVLQSLYQQIRENPNLQGDMATRQVGSAKTLFSDLTHQYRRQLFSNALPEMIKTRPDLAADAALLNNNQADPKQQQDAYGRLQAALQQDPNTAERMKQITERPWSIAPPLEDRPATPVTPTPVAPTPTQPPVASSRPAPAEMARMAGTLRTANMTATDKAKTLGVDMSDPRAKEQLLSMPTVRAEAVRTLVSDPTVRQRFGDKTEQIAPSIWDNMSTTHKWLFWGGLGLAALSMLTSLFSSSEDSSIAPLLMGGIGTGLAGYGLTGGQPQKMLQGQFWRDAGKGIGLNKLPLLSGMF